MTAALSLPVPCTWSGKTVGKTHPGLRRDTNEDAFSIDPDLGLMVVADGMGGHAAGEVAAQMTVDTVTGVLCDAPQGGWPSAPFPPHAAGVVLAGAIQRANTAVFSAAQRSPALRGMGTTVIAALAFRDCVAVAHVGDSRAYLLRERWLARLTEDHTVANDPRNAGMELRSLARYIGFGHALTRSIGARSTVDVDTRHLSPRSGDVLLLCTDGLTNAISEKEIAEILIAHRDLDEAAERLIDGANDNGGPDNVTVALHRWS